jgi:tetratricopeptide (TPR) repeat protein
MAIPGPMKELLRRRRLSSVYFPLLLGGLLLLGGCGWTIGVVQNMRLRSLDADIRKSTKEIEAARDDKARATAYSKRGVAYSEKARYGRAFKIIPAPEYERLFDLAVKDHDQAIALNPGSAEVYFNRGHAYYDRAFLDQVAHSDPKTWFDHASADFEMATEKDAGNFMAFDMLGLATEQNGEWDQAIRAYTQERALNRLGKMRLADVYCSRGQQRHKEKNYDAAAADYQKSIEIGASPDDGCTCEPYNSLLSIYDTQTRQYDKAWDLVHQAQKSKRQIDVGLVDQLRKDSGRND